MTIPQVRQRKPMVNIHVRIPVELREQAKEVAKEQGVNESDVYRTAMEFFFGQMDTNCLPHGEHDVDEAGQTQLQTG